MPTSTSNPTVEINPSDLHAVRRFLTADRDEVQTAPPAPARKPHHLSNQPVALRHGIARSRVRSAASRAD